MHIADVTNDGARDPPAFGGRGVPQAETVARLGTVSHLEPEGSGPTGCVTSDIAWPAG